MFQRFTSSVGKIMKVALIYMKKTEKRLKKSDQDNSFYAIDVFQKYESQLST